MFLSEIKTQKFLRAFVVIDLATFVLFLFGYILIVSEAVYFFDPSGMFVLDFLIFLAYSPMLSIWLGKILPVLNILGFVAAIVIYKRNYKNSNIKEQRMLLAIMVLFAITVALCLLVS